MVNLSEFRVSIVAILSRNVAKFVFYWRKKITLNFIQYPSYMSVLRRYAVKNRSKNAEKCTLFLTVSPRNRPFTVCPFLPEARNMGFFFPGTLKYSVLLKV